MFNIYLKNHNLTLTAFNEQHAINTLMFIYSVFNTYESIDISFIPSLKEGVNNV